MSNLLKTTLRVRNLLVAVGICWTLAILPAWATVRVTGNVTPADNPSTQITNEGIVDYVFDEGVVLNELVPQDDFSHAQNIVVGETSFGSLLVDGSTSLRYEHLIIGGSPDDADAGSNTELSGSRFGVGVVRFEGFGVVYNNDPDILPAEVLAATLPGGGTVTSEMEFDPNSPRTGTDMDVYVGLTGSGTLEVGDGARMEIQDGLFAGLGEFSYGEILVEGFGSHIDQRGASSADDNNTDATGLMLIGPVGFGKMTVRDGAQVDARVGAAIGALTEDGGVGLIGGIGGGIPGLGLVDRGGRGEVLVDGPGSAWRIGNGLSVGEFQPDIEDYMPNAGEGHMVVSNSGLVQMIGTLDENDTDGPASMVLGKFGKVDLDDGRIVIQDVYLSDGVLRGDGRIDLSHFSNRVLGEVRVGLDQKLLVVSDADVQVSDDIGAFYMANDGLIEVLGGEIEFERLIEGPDDVFRNRFVPGEDGDPDDRGVILGQDSIMRFRSGISNEGVMAWSHGNNVVSGDVINEVDAELIISGFSNVTFEDDLINNGTLELAADGSFVTMTVLGDFIGTTSAALNMNLGGGQTGAEVSHIAVAGDIALSGELQVDIATVGSNPINPMPGDEFEIISGARALAGQFTVLDLPALADPGWSWFIDTSNSDVTLQVLDIMAVGGDFNGDGIVDGADLAIWEMNFGITMGATGVLGDADGDGDVDGQDYFVWLAQVGGPGMGAGALVGDPPGGAQPVPEPATLGIALLGLAAVAAARLRR